MIKLIPLIIFPLSFFLIFLGVKNLTGNFPLDKENINQNDEEEIVKFDEDSKKSERKVLTEVEQNSVYVDENITNTEEKEKKSIKTENVKESVEKKKLVGKPEQTLSNSIKNKKTTDNFSNINIKENNKFLIQFGAFSKKKNAEDLKNSVVENLKKKFPNFSISLDFDEKRGLYKLISQTDDIEKAKKVCSFSKEIKINCLFKKQ